MASLFIARLPTLGNVEVFEVELIDVNRCGPFLQHLKSKCRELARSESCLLVSPTTGALHSGTFGGRPPMNLWIMARAGYIDNPKLQDKLKNLGMKVIQRGARVTETMLQTCYQFSLTARLAPKWNLLTSWMVQGMEFMSTGRPAQAVVLKAGVTKTEITLSVNVLRLTFNFLKPSDLELSTTTLAAFHSDPHSVVSETSIYNNRCLLLPNMTVGYVCSVSHQLPASLEFPTYDSIRLHWKKQHGMILPEKQSIFFQIFFKSNSRNFFSYPGCCVLKCPPTASSSRDSRAVATSFITDLHSRMPSLCGETIRYSGKALTPCPSLSTAALSGAAYPNLRPAPSSTARSGASGGGSQPHRGTKTLCSGLIERVSAAMASKSSSKSGSHSYSSTQSVPDVNARSGYCSVGAGGGRGQPSEHLESGQTLPSHNGSTATHVANTRIVPVFKTSHRAVAPLHSVQQKQPTKPTPLLPSFRPNRSAAPNHMSNTGTNRPGTTHEAAKRLPGQKRIMFTDHSQPPPKRPMTPSTATTTASRPRGSERGTLSLEQCQRRIFPTGTSEQMVPDLQTDIDCHFTTVGEQNSLQYSQNQHRTGHPAHNKGKGGKPVIQVEGVSAETINKMLKVKIPLLKRWLQENGVKATGRRNKDDLVRMAANHIRDTGTTFTIPPS